MPKNTSSVLYRKYRPDDWNAVLGQDHIVSVLENGIKLKRISHAYLFSGSRGTGKTSIARIFAKSLGVSDNDIYEIDAASNRGIDDIREIRDGVNVLPFESEYKVYIIDEVHMLTKEAFNAILKTLEEPPAHAIFILATTELEKVPETIVSRCQSFIFKKPTDNILTSAVTNVAKKEGYTLEEGGAGLIALLADGAFRDAYGTLQKVISFSSVEQGRGKVIFVVLSLLNIIPTIFAFVSLEVISSNVMLMDNQEEIFVISMVLDKPINGSMIISHSSNIIPEVQELSFLDNEFVINNGNYKYIKSLKSLKKGPGSYFITVSVKDAQNNSLAIATNCKVLSLS